MPIKERGCYKRRQ